MKYGHSVLSRTLFSVLFDRSLLGGDREIFFVESLGRSNPESFGGLVPELIEPVSLDLFELRKQTYLSRLTLEPTLERNTLGL